MKVEAFSCTAQLESNEVPGRICDGFEYTLLEKTMSIDPSTKAGRTYQYYAERRR